MNVDLTARERKRKYAMELSELRKEFREGVKEIHDWRDKHDDAIERRYLEEKENLQDKTKRAISEQETRFSRLLLNLDAKYADNRSAEKTNAAAKKSQTGSTAGNLPPLPRSNVEIHHNSYWRDQLS
jgi:hypothetical protein